MKHKISFELFFIAMFTLFGVHEIFEQRYLEAVLSALVVAISGYQIWFHIRNGKKDCNND